VFDTFFPSLEIVGTPDHTRVLVGEIPHPHTGLPIRLYDTRTFNRVEQVQHSLTEIAFLAADGSVQTVHRSEVSSRYIYKHEMALLLRVAGFARWEICSDFDGRPLTRESDAMVVTAWNGELAERCTGKESRCSITFQSLGCCDSPIDLDETSRNSDDLACMVECKSRVRRLTELNMDVHSMGRAARLAARLGCVHLVLCTVALADPVYTAIDLGTGAVTYGVDSSGNGTVTGSNGLTYTFNPVQNYLPAQWQGTTQRVPTVEPAPVWDRDTYGNPKYAYSYSNLVYMNNQGLAAGINVYGVAGHLSNSEAFFTQQQANGTWGPPGGFLWSGATNIGNSPLAVGIQGISPTGQVLGFGTIGSYSTTSVMYLYDTKAGTLTNLTNLVNSLTWTNPSRLPAGQSPNWVLNSPVGHLDNSGRILIEADEGGNWQSPHELLLIPAGLAADPFVPAPEPAAWAVFASLIGYCVAHRWLGSRTFGNPKPSRL
jgi:hypothetical protein